jgi:hypothetical protein
MRGNGEPRSPIPDSMRHSLEQDRVKIQFQFAFIAVVCQDLDLRLGTGHQEAGLVPANCI